ncbi:CaiB/BaiF CoA transferase family protein [Oceanobacillus jeddahense]|uniref:CaiB/BaiF CoA transferase family protein n=1 Tax=Oceanobacillus jeddahense TaxID=1462527 RepID=UPI0005963BFC|nr:CoA transferase [Oceanobacillus jeddahense]
MKEGVNEMNNSPLKGIRVLDISTMLAAPWAATHLADFGAEVIKVEHPIYGDHARRYGKQKGNVPLLWKSLSRNKKSITLNLSNEMGQKIIKDQIKHFDVIIENFRPGTLERWGIDYDTLSEINPKVIMLRTSGFGQDGPYANRRGFGTVAEGMSGFTSVNGDETGPPTLPGMPLADGVSGVFGALSIMIALYERSQNESFQGQCIDISLYEPLMRFLEPQLIAYDQLGEVAERMGNGSLQTAPRNAYETKDKKWIALSASAQSIAENLFNAIGRPDLIKDARFATNKDRLKNVDELDQIIGEWIRERNMDDAVNTLNESGAVVGPMYDVKQIYEDPHYIERESFVNIVDEDLGNMKLPNVFAKFSRTPGEVKTTGPQKGEHNEEIFQNLFGFSAEELAELKKKEII